MGVICGNIVVICIDRRSRSKQLQPSNREWATAIEYVDSDGFVLPLFLIRKEVRTFYKVNIVFSKRCKAKRIRI